jgi:hypothetical protein
VVRQAGAGCRASYRGILAKIDLDFDPEVIVGLTLRSKVGKIGATANPKPATR